MKIDIKLVAYGNMDGQIVWVCDFRQHDINKKPIRSVPPTRVKIVPAGDKNVYYSDSYFAKLNSKDEVVKSGVIKPFDNTGYRFMTGAPVNVFDNEKECVEYWNQQLMDQIDVFAERKNIVLTELDNKISKLENKIVGPKITIQ